MAKKANPEMKACACCTVRFRPDLCPQCYVAGCAHKGKGKPCRLSSDTQKTQEIPEFQLRESYSKLLEDNRKVVAEAQRLVRIIYAKDPALLENAGIKSNGHAEFPPQPAEPSTALRGEIPHG
jgi:hypothetical protein